MPTVQKQVQIHMSQTEIKQAILAWLIEHKHLNDEEDGDVSIVFNSKRAMGAHGQELYATISMSGKNAQET